MADRDLKQIAPPTGVPPHLAYEKTCDYSTTKSGAMSGSGRVEN
jgi:hypothetical protein